jgi:sugar phosphate isomerase/epimerase
MVLILTKKATVPGLNNFSSTFICNAMTYNRRKFLKTGSAFAAGVALTGWACNNQRNNTSSTPAGNNETGRKAANSFGIQLYTLRDDMPNDPKGVLKQLSDFGYTQIESYEGAKGMFWGMSNIEFRDYLLSLNMTAVSSHCDFRKDLAKKAADAAAIGMSYLVCPWLGPQKKLDDFKRIADEFNAAGDVCKKAGIRFAYHNHAYSFKDLEGELPQDVLMTRTDSSLVDFEMDYYWVVTAGHSPERWMQRYPNRFRLCHIKDRIKDIPATEEFASCTLGEGSIDFLPIFKSGRENGMKYLIVEQERYDKTTPLKSAESNAAYMKKQLVEMNKMKW